MMDPLAQQIFALLAGIALLAFVLLRGIDEPQNMDEIIDDAWKKAIEGTDMEKPHDET